MKIIKIFLVLFAMFVAYNYYSFHKTKNELENFYFEYGGEIGKKMPCEQSLFPWQFDSITRSVQKARYLKKHQFRLSKKNEMHLLTWTKDGSNSISEYKNLSDLNFWQYTFNPTVAYIILSKNMEGFHGCYSCNFPWKLSYIKNGTQFVNYIASDSLIYKDIENIEWILLDTTKTAYMPWEYFDIKILAFMSYDDSVYITTTCKSKEYKHIIETFPVIRSKLSEQLKPIMARHKLNALRFGMLLKESTWQKIR